MQILQGLTSQLQDIYCQWHANLCGEYDRDNRSNQVPWVNKSSLSSSIRCILLWHLHQGQRRWQDAGHVNMSHCHEDTSFNNLLEQELPIQFDYVTVCNCIIVIWSIVRKLSWQNAADWWLQPLSSTDDDRLFKSSLVPQQWQCYLS